MIGHTNGMKVLDSAGTKYAERERGCTLYADTLRRIKAADGDIEDESRAVWEWLRQWNRRFYQCNPLLLKTHPAAIHDFLLLHRWEIERYRTMTLEKLPMGEQAAVVNLFQAIEKDLGSPVGAAKVLHVLVPRVFPLWDRKITRGYRITLLKAGMNGKRYWRFMRTTRCQCLKLRERGCDEPDLLKRLDERNYVTYTLGLPCG